VTATPAVPPPAFLPAAAAATAGILVGTGIVATRFVIQDTEPASLALMRYAIGLACLVPPLLATPRVRIPARDLVPVALLGIGQFGILIALLNYGLKFIPAALGALIFAVFPLLTMLLAAALRLEALTAAKSLGVGLTIAGVGLALADKLALAEPGQGAWIGAAAVLGSAACGALCSVLYRPYLGRYPTLQVSTYAMAAAVLFLAGLAGSEGFFAHWPRLSGAGWGAVAFIGVSSGAGYFLWLYALRHASPTRVTAFLALNPITAAALGALVLGESITMGLLLGLAAVAAGLWFAHR
jgi:drug/metabolite transporter (DMT)-like permease